MRRIALVLVVVFLCVSALGALSAASAEAFTAVPNVLRPGKYYEISVEASSPGNANLELLDLSGAPVYTIFSGYPLAAGLNTLTWDGVRLDHTVIEPGDYLLRLSVPDGPVYETQIRVGAPYPLITKIWQSDFVLAENELEIGFEASEDGTLRVQLKNYQDDSVTDMEEIPVSKGENSFQWGGNVNGARVTDGSYALILTLQTPGGNESVAQYVMVEAKSAETAEEDGAIVVTDVTPPPEPDPTPIPPPLLSPPYSSQNDGTFWSMTPGELDDQVIWDILMQPITVYDGVEARDHVYLMENPDGTGKKVAQIHGKSQGLHVLSERNEHGYVLVEAFSNYDRTYYPKTDEEKATVFDLKRGYIKASGLKTVNVQQDKALLIDKLTQRMYLFINGERVTEFLISTGTFRGDDYLFETVPGEFITVSHTGTLVDGNMNSAMAIRINGGILVHEVPHKLRADGSFDYSSFEGYLGTKQSHGCIRVQRLKTPEGYNQRWIWENFKRGAPYKVIIWDDRGRVDTPATWQQNPKN